MHLSGLKPCPSAVYWSCSRAAHVQLSQLPPPAHYRSDRGWLFLKWNSQNFWTEAFFSVKIMTFQQYHMVLLLLSEPQPKMFCNTSYTTNTTHSHSVWSQLQQKHNHINNPLLPDEWIGQHDSQHCRLVLAVQFCSGTWCFHTSNPMAVLDLCVSGWAQSIWWFAIKI